MGETQYFMEWGSERKRKKKRTQWKVAGFLSNRFFEVPTNNQPR
jgi:hypothetical protein